MERSWLRFDARLWNEVLQFWFLIEKCGDVRLCRWTGGQTWVPSMERKTPRSFQALDDFRSFNLSEENWWHLVDVREMDQRMRVLCGVK